MPKISASGCKINFHNELADLTSEIKDLNNSLKESKEISEALRVIFQISVVI